MATYYVDVTQDFADQTGVNNTGNEYYGPGGLQAAIWGSGAATALVAGDTLYAKFGTADLSKYVVAGVDLDKTGTWVIGDAVQNHNDAGGASGDDWVGKLVYITANLVYFQINNASTDVASVNNGDGIDNTTRGETIPGANMLNSGADGIICDTNSGDAVTGHIKMIGCDAAWNPGEGLHSNHDASHLVTLDGDGAATVCFYGGNAIHYWWLESIKFTNASANNIDHHATNGDYWVFRYCVSDSAGAAGFRTLDFTGPRVHHCVFSNNTTHGFYSAPYTDAWACRTFGNGSVGIGVGGLSSCTACLSYNNSDDNFILTSTVGVFVNCVGDGSVAGSGLNIGAQKGVAIRGCRFTNNFDHGIEMSAAVNDTNTENFNVFHNNGNGDLQNIVSGYNSYGDAANHISEPPDDGYVDHKLEFDYDNLVGAFQVGEKISTVGGKEGYITADAAGNIIYNRADGGIFANNDAIPGTDSGATADVNEPVTGTANWSTYHMEVDAAELLSARNAADEIDLFWDDAAATNVSAWVCAGLPIEYPVPSAGGGVGRGFLRGVA